MEPRCRSRLKGIDRCWGGIKVDFLSVLPVDQILLWAEPEGAGADSKGLTGTGAVSKGFPFGAPCRSNGLPGGAEVQEQTKGIDWNWGGVKGIFMFLVSRKDFPSLRDWIFRDG